jgi:putative endonuclease
MREPAVYIMASQRNGTIYIDVTSNLLRRVDEHRNGLISGFTQKYGYKPLVFYELHETMLSALAREKQIKGGSRKAKLKLIEAANPQWRDIYTELVPA